MESALNLPPVGFINVGKRRILVPLDINLLATESAGPPVSPHPVVLSGWGGKKKQKKLVYLKIQYTCTYFFALYIYRIHFH